MNRFRKMNRSTQGLSAMVIFGIVACSLSGCVRSMLQSRLPESADAQQSVVNELSTPQLRSPADLKPSESAQTCVATAESLAAKGHDSEAVKLLLRARQLDPGQQHVAHRLAVLYDRHGNDQRALSEYESALQESPTNANLLNDLGFFHYQRGNWTQAEQYFEAALQQAPENKRAQTNLALTYAKQGNFEASLEVFTRAVGPAAAHSNLGVLYAQAGRLDDAQRELRRALAIDPSLAQADAILAQITRGTAVASHDASPNRR